MSGILQRYRGAPGRMKLPTLMLLKSRCKSCPHCVAKWKYLQIEDTQIDLSREHYFIAQQLYRGWNQLAYLLVV
jgi:hypothetical protein